MSDPANHTTPTRPPAQRSPAYPSMSLPAAIDRARKVWDAQRKHEAHIDAVLGVIGYTNRSGPALRAIGAMNHYGLFEESGSKDARRLALSELAQDIVLLPESDSRYQSAVKLAALKPAIYTALWERYSSHLPDDAAIKPFLIRDKGFNDNVVDDLLQNYRETFTFAKLDSISSDGLSQDHVAPRAAPSATAVPDAVSRQPSSEAVVRASYQPPTSAPIEENELPILVGPGKIARIPFPMSHDDFELLIGTLQLWKKRLVRNTTGFPRAALWKNADFDKPVTIVGEMGERDGVRFYQSQDGTGIPEGELTFA